MNQTAVEKLMRDLIGWAALYGSEFSTLPEWDQISAAKAREYVAKLQVVLAMGDDE